MSVWQFQQAVNGYVDANSPPEKEKASPEEVAEIKAEILAITEQNKRDYPHLFK